MASNQTEEMLKLRSSDGQEFQISRRAAVLSPRIKELAGDDNDVILLTDVDYKTLPIIIDYLSGNFSDEELEKLVINDPAFAFFHMAKAARYLRLRSLHKLICDTTAAEIRNATPKQILEIFKDHREGGDERRRLNRRQEKYLILGVFCFSLFVLLLVVLCS